METTFIEYQFPYKKNNNMKNFADDDNFIFHHYTKIKKHTVKFVNTRLILIK